MTALAMVPPAAVTQLLSTFDRGQLEGFVAVAIDLMDMADERTDENSPNFASIDDGLPGCLFDQEPTAYDQSWNERLDQSKPLPDWPFKHEDVEEDDGAGECTDDEPGFDKTSRRIANAYGGRGPGCTISDPDYGIDDLPQGTSGYDC